MLGKFLMLFVVVAAIMLLASQEAAADDCFFKSCVPLVTDCGWLKSCKDFCCSIDFGKK
jgi:hypothetical protein